MIDNELRRTCDFLRSKLADYLRNKGINPASKFSCLNPDHLDRMPSMSYSEQNFTVRCFSCNAEYDIFKLIGIDYGLRDFASQFKKAHEMFIGPVAPEILERLNLERVGTRPQIPDFTITDDYEISASHDSFLHRQETPFGGIHQEDQHVRSSINDEPSKSPVNQSQNSPMMQFNPSQGVVFGGNYDYPRHDQMGITSAVDSFSSRDRVPFDSMLDRDSARFDFSEYFNNCILQLNKTDYYRQRGISEEVVRKFRLGYDDHYVCGMDQMGMQQLWRAAIIPIGKYSCLVRNTDRQSKDRMRKKGPFDLFNRQALDAPGAIFITEGEFDALSLETLGYKAVALGGAGNVRAALEIFKNQRNIDRTFYVCLDSDGAGREAEKLLVAGLRQYGINFRSVNLAFPYKDVNEALCADRAGLKDRLEHLEELLNFTLTPLPQAERTFLVRKGEEFNRLDEASGLYSLCGKPSVLRKLLSGMIEDRICSIIYAGTDIQWQYLANSVGMTGSNNVKADPSYYAARLLEVSSDIPASVERGMLACRLRGDVKFLTVVDLTVLTAEHCVEAVQRLCAVCQKTHLPVLVLCNSKCSSYVEALTVQNLEVCLNERGDFSFTTEDDSGKTINFVKYTGN
ncbi:MAG: toprim domain-containing protein [Succinivibrio sp.]|nr:toprim domain-containing protein [Succinivibrio sp.]